MNQFTIRIKVVLLFLYTAVVVSPSHAQNIAINNTGAIPATSAVLDVNAPDKGLLIPRLDAIQRNAIAAPASGLLIFNTTSGQLELWNSASWLQLSNVTIAAANPIGASAGRSVAISSSPSTADPSAILDIQSTTGGLLIPRMSGTQRDAVSSPVVGLLIYNTTAQLLNFYSSTGWQQLCGTAVSSITGSITTAANMGINTSAPDPSAMLDITSVNSGLAIPRLTAAQRNAILSPAQGLMIYNLTTQSINVYNGSGKWLDYTVQTIPDAPVAGANVPAQSQITWNWLTVNGASGYKYNTINNYNMSIDNGNDTAYAETGLTCNSKDTLFIWAYNCTGSSSATMLTQPTSACDTSSCSNTWSQKANFGGGPTNTPVGFSIGTKGYIGTGSGSAVGSGNAFWQWDQATNVWTQMADVGGPPRVGAVGFSIGTKGYIGTGYNANNADPLGDFWEWDQASNIWTQKANFGGTARYWATGFSIGTKGYIGTGSTHTTDFWEWDQGSNIWTQKASFPGASRYYATGFSIDTEGYIGLGYDNNTGHKDFWQWDQGSNQWSPIATYPGLGGYGGASFSIGSKGYVGTGVPASGDHSNDFWEWNSATNIWTQKANYPAGTGDLYDVGLSIGNKGYIGTGVYNGQAFWEYCP